MRRRLWLVACCALATACDGGGGAPLPHDGDAVIGQIRSVRLEEAAPAVEIARRHAVGLNELARANPHVSGLSSGKIAAGTELTVPARFVLPDAPREGIVVNIAERRLYYYPRTGWRTRRVLTFPAAVGREDWETPTGRTSVAERIKNPEWAPPDSIRAEAERTGAPLPEIVPPGPQNPLGEYALRLGWKKHLIHGTTSPLGVGRPITHGCIRLYPEDMELLFRSVDEGTSVVLVDQPYKIGVSDGALYLESHPAASRLDPSRRRIVQHIERWARGKQDRRIDRVTLRRALEEQSGIPVRISL